MFRPQAIRLVARLLQYLKRQGIGHFSGLHRRAVRAETTTIETTTTETIDDSLRH